MYFIADHNWVTSSQNCVPTINNLSYSTFSLDHEPNPRLWSVHVLPCTMPVSQFSISEFQAIFVHEQWIVLYRIVGDDDNGVLFTPDQYEDYKKNVASKRQENRHVFKMDSPHSNSAAIELLVNGISYEIRIEITVMCQPWRSFLSCMYHVAFSSSRVYVSWANSKGMDCKLVGPETKCFCQHRYVCLDIKRHTPHILY